MLFETAQVALEQLKDDAVFERVAFRVLRKRHPDLRLTSATGDTGLDAYERPLFESDVRVAVWVSLQSTWQKKLQTELEKNKKQGRRAKAIFATNRSTNEIGKNKQRKLAKDDFGVDLEILDLAELAAELESDDLRWVAEVELGVRPRQPRGLSTSAQYLDKLVDPVPGMDAPLVGRTEVKDQLRDALTTQDPAPRVVVVEGPGGIGKTRLALEVAQTIATTLVVPTGAVVSLETFAEAPLDAPLIMVIDDAHRSASLSAVAALLADERFDRVRLVFTNRPGHRDRVLYASGAEKLSTDPVQLRALHRQEIDRIITDHGIQHESFRKNVIRVAEGIPLLAHAACRVALASGTFGWSDGTGILRDLISSRLASFPSTDMHRATAVALALLSKAGDLAGHHGGRDLAVLHSAITTLPGEADHLDRLLDDLADAGLAGNLPYAIRPDLAAVVLVADALIPQTRVRLDTGTALQKLLAHAGMKPEMTAEERSDRLSGAATRLGPQLAVLAVAIRESENAAAGDELSQFVLGLLPEDAHLGHWAAVAHLAFEAAAAVPSLFFELVERLVGQWPVQASPMLWGSDELAHYRHELGQLNQKLSLLAARTDLVNDPSAVAALLNVAWLTDAAQLSPWDDRPDPILHAITGKSASPAPTTPASSAALMTNRKALLDAIRQWTTDRASEPPYGLAPDEAAIRGPATTARVLLDALQPLLSITVEHDQYGTPQVANTFVSQTLALPDLPETAKQLRQALELVVPLLDEPALRKSDELSVLKSVIGLPRQLRKEAARGFPGSERRPLPDHAVSVLESEAAAFSQVIAECWADLPLNVRRAAAAATIPPGPQKFDLTAVAATGDAVAAAALADPEVERLLIIQPPNKITSDWQADLQRQQEAARALAAKVSPEEAVDLLEAADPMVLGYVREVLSAFARTVGESTQEPAPLLERLARAPLAGEGALLAGLATQHPEVVWQWAMEHLADARITALALAIADSHPDRETALQAAVTDEMMTEADAPQAIILAEHLAQHLYACTQPAEDRLRLLADLGDRGPADALPEVLHAIGLVLHGLGTAELDNEVAVRCVVALRRRLAQNDDAGRNHSDENSAFGAEHIAARTPVEFADALVEHLFQGQLLPVAWAARIGRCTIAVREQVTQALAEQWQARAAPDEAVESAMAQAFTAIGEGTHCWADSLTVWAAGSGTERRRAAVAVHSTWSSQAWAEIVPQLLAAGLDPRSKDLLMDGLTGALDATTDPEGEMQRRREAVEPLRRHERATVRAFASESINRINSFSKFIQSAQSRSRNGYSV